MQKKKNHTKKPPQNIKEIEPVKYKIIAWKTCKFSARVMLENEKGVYIVWVTKDLQKNLDVLKPYFVYYKTPEKKEELYFYLKNKTRILPYNC